MPLPGDTPSTHSQPGPNHGVEPARRVTFIVPVKNQLPLTRALVDTVRATNPGVEVEWVIVDSGSTDGTLAYCAEIGARVVPFPRQPFNYCAAVNAGATVATGDLWLISNNDIEFRSPGDLQRLIRLFADWPILAVVSPGRESGAAELEFGGYWLWGACWATRPKLFREWGGLPEELSGYGFDEFYTVSQCWRRGYAVGRLTGWNVFHHGSATFAETGGTTTPAIRRNFSRLLKLLDASDLDRGNDFNRILKRLQERELTRAPRRLVAPGASAEWLARQGYAAAHRDTARLPDTELPAWIWGDDKSREQRQWLPWLANELLLQPDAKIVGQDGWYAVRTAPNESIPTLSDLCDFGYKARAIGPPPSPLMPAEKELRPNLRQRLAAFINDWRHRHTKLPPEW